MPAALPAVAQAATVTHGDVKLHIDNSDILKYAIQLMTIMSILFAIVWLCIHIWNCINTRNLGKLQEKLTFMKFLYADKLIYMSCTENAELMAVATHGDSQCCS